MDRLIAPGTQPGAQPADLTKGLGRLAVLVLLHEAGSLEMSLHDRASSAAGISFLGTSAAGPAVLGAAAGSSCLWQAVAARDIKPTSSARKHRS